jgi:hypothetical protein
MVYSKNFSGAVFLFGNGCVRPLGCNFFGTQLTVLARQIARPLRRSEDHGHKHSSRGERASSSPLESTKLSPLEPTKLPDRRRHRRTRLGGRLPRLDDPSRRARFHFHVEHLHLAPATEHGYWSTARMGRVSSSGGITRRRRWLIWSPPLFISAIIPQFELLIKYGFGGGAIIVALLGIGGGYALAGRGRLWIRIVVGALVAFVTLVGGTMGPDMGPEMNQAFALSTPRGTWMAVLFMSFVVVLMIACAILQRIGRPQP